MGTSITALPPQTPQPPSVWQRLTGAEPSTAPPVPGSEFDVTRALRNGSVGAAVAGALGGVSLIGKVALPLIGKVTSLAGLGRLALVGGAIGVASAAAPVLLNATAGRPAARAALIGAGIGAAAGAVLPFVPISLGAMVGAGVGLLVHDRSTRDDRYTQYPGYVAYPGWQQYGMAPGLVHPSLVPMAPSYGAYPGMLGGYATPQLGYGVLPAQAQPVAQPAAQQAMQPVAQPAPRPAPRPTAAPRYRNARTFTDAAGNVRRVGSGTIVKAGRTPVAAATQQPVAMVQEPATGAAAGLLSSPYASATNLAALAAMMPQAMAGSVPTLTGVQPSAAAIPAMPTS